MNVVDINVKIIYTENNSEKKKRKKDEAQWLFIIWLVINLTELHMMKCATHTIYLGRLEKEDMKLQEIAQHNYKANKFHLALEKNVIIAQIKINQAIIVIGVSNSSI